MNPMPPRYTRTAMTLHWLIAAAVLAQIASAGTLRLSRSALPRARPSSIFHKSTGS